LIIPWIIALALADPPSVLVVFDSRTGHTERMARAVAEGVAQVEGVQAIVRGREDVRDDEILSASGIVLGSPVHWASLSPESKSFLERVGKVLAEAKELGPGSTPRTRAAGAFVTGGAVSSGKELARLAILAAFLNMRFVVVGGEEADGFGTLGAQATTGETDPGLSEAELEEARRFGKRFASMTLALVR
jgi:NAD(P)H dehydrogenase (quinone)